jgi:predicted nucleic acid-binding protein
MRCLDKARAMDAAGERLSVAAPVVTEILRGAYFRGGKELKQSLELLASLDVLDIDDEVAAEAGRMGAELLKRGTDIGTVDLLIAAVVKLNRQILITRDKTFFGIPDLSVESY